MLVLTRGAGEAVCVGPGVTVKVERVGGGRVKLAIDAPKDVRILRGELVGAEPGKAVDRG